MGWMPHSFCSVDPPVYQPLELWFGPLEKVWPVWMWKPDPKMWPFPRFEMGH